MHFNAWYGRGKDEKAELKRSINRLVFTWNIFKYWGNCRKADFPRHLDINIWVWKIRVRKYAYKFKTSSPYFCQWQPIEESFYKKTIDMYKAYLFCQLYNDGLNWRDLLIFEIRSDYRWVIFEEWFSRSVSNPFR